jgi:hypothetical protein
VEIWSSGKTLSSWVIDLEYALEVVKSREYIEIVPFDWKPRHSVPIHASKRKQRSRSSLRLIRLFAYGVEKVRKRVLDAFSDDWDAEMDLFVS